jgi:hypothetical protein
VIGKVILQGFLWVVTVVFLPRALVSDTTGLVFARRTVSSPGRGGWQDVLRANGPCVCIAQPNGLGILDRKGAVAVLPLIKSQMAGPLALWVK